MLASTITWPDGGVSVSELNKKVNRMKRRTSHPITRVQYGKKDEYTFLVVDYGIFDVFEFVYRPDKPAQLCPPEGVLLGMQGY